MSEEKPYLEFKSHSLREIANIMKLSKSQVARDLKETEKKINNNDEEFLESFYGVIYQIAKKMSQIAKKQRDINGTAF